MKRSLSIAQLKAHLSEAVAAVQQRGHEIVIEKHGRRVARLVPIDGAPRAGLIGLASLLEDDDAAAFADVLDRVVTSRRKDKPRRVPRLG